MSTPPHISLSDFLDGANAWLNANTTPRPPSGALTWGEGSDRVSLFRDSSPEEERAQVEALLAWQRKKADAGYGSIAWPVEYGGAGLPRAYEAAFRQLEQGFVAPLITESVSISLEITAPTILALGAEAQKSRWIAALRRGDAMCCQMFSEPGAGSDLGAIALRATPDGDGWILNGQKVWTSGAQYADIGFLVALTNRDAPRQSALTAFLVPLKDVPGIDIRPLRQMTGGSNFNEVFFNDVRISDTDRVGAVGAGWAGAMTALGFERGSAATGGGGNGPDLFGRLVLAARHTGQLQDPLVRQKLANIYARNRMRSWTGKRAAARLRAGGVPGPEGSITKLAYTRALQDMAELAGMLLGPSAIADTGEWGTFAWSEFICGVPGLRLGGGTDEIQKNTIAERSLGLPREVR
jgi:alkylation response protein AidB-like acyl-CoA dehydrogenase